jgi:hypothetical protein
VKVALAAVAVTVVALAGQPVHAALASLLRFLP